MRMHFLILPVLAGLTACGSGNQTTPAPGATPNVDSPPVSTQPRAADAGAADAASATSPSWSATAADNSRQNAGDGSATAATPMDQGDSPEDIRITQDIRKALVADSSLSTDAQNIKVITRGGNVVLRGPVKDDGECKRVQTIATGVAGVAKVDNQTSVIAH